MHRRGRNTTNEELCIFVNTCVMEGPLPSSLNFEPFELNCHCIPLLMVFLVTMRTASFLCVFLNFFVWAKPLVV